MGNHLMFSCTQLNNKIEFHTINNRSLLVKIEKMIMPYIEEAFDGSAVTCNIEVDGESMQVFLQPLSIVSNKIEEIETIQVTGFVVVVNEFINKGIAIERMKMEELLKTIYLLPNSIFKAKRDKAGRIYKVFSEGGLAREFNMTTEHIKGKYLEDIYSGELADAMVPALKRSFLGETVEFLSEYKGRVFNNVIKPICKDQNCMDTIVCNEPSGASIIDEVIGYITEVTEHKLTEKTLLHHINHDQLTGLPNRILFHDRLTQAIIQAEPDYKKFALLVFDLDRFKLINDSLGHAIGDLLLQAVAKRLKEWVSNIDTVARVSGDNFSIIIQHIVHEDNAKEIAETIIQSLSNPFMIQGHELYVSSSVGISVYPNDGIDIDMLMKNADIALHQAKEKGRNTCQKYRYEMNSNHAKCIKLESDLRKAIELEEFEVYYQPQTDAATGEIIGMEALVRWQHPDLGIVLPSEFIPVAEETGLIIKIGEWVLREACRQTKAWQDAGYHHKTISVNLSAKQFQQDNLVEMVASILNEFNLDPSYLVLEITETISMQNIEFVIRTLNELNELGIQVSIDDFGTGYSSLMYLKSFPIHSLKIDRSFIRDITGDSDDAAIALAIIAMAHSLKLKVVAEGVETKGQLQYLKDHKCDNFQGYLFSKPVPAKEFESKFMSKSSESC